MKNKLALITGANSGIGFETAKALVKLNYDLIIIARNSTKATAAVSNLKQFNSNVSISSYIADLSNLDSVKKVANEIKNNFSVIDRLICNAGFGPDKVEFHSSGLELSLVANHLGHFVLVNNLLPLVEASSEGRIINVASSAYKLGKVERLFKLNNKDASALQVYGDSKLANVLFTKALSNKLNKSTSYSLHPGVVNSGFGANYTGMFKLMAAIMRPFMISPEKGAATSVYLATTELENIKSFSGGFFIKSKHVSINSEQVSDIHAEWLWQKSIEFSNV
jgi:retinol dehydrogenase 12